MTAVESALAEVTDALALIQPQLDGLVGLSREPLSPDATAALTDAIKVHKHRVQTLTVVEQALGALLRDGYPTVPSFAVTNEVRAELQEQVEEMRAALERFIAELAGDAVTGTVVFAKPRPA